MKITSAESKDSFEFIAGYSVLGLVKVFKSPAMKAQNVSRTLFLDITMLSKKIYFSLDPARISFGELPLLLVLAWMKDLWNGCAFLSYLNSLKAEDIYPLSFPLLSSLIPCAQTL